MSVNINKSNTRNIPKVRGQVCARSKKMLVPFFIFHFSFFIFQCGVDVEDSTPPSPPVWIQKSFPEDWPERGIDAHESGGIYLEWVPNPEEDIIAYNIYRAIWFDDNDSLGEYSLRSRVDLNSQTSLVYIDRQLESGMFHYYRLTAEDVTSNESAYSDPIYYSLLPRISVEFMIPNGLTECLHQNEDLRWKYNYYSEMEEYCITVLTDEDVIITRQVFLPGNYTGEWEYWHLPADILLDSGKVYKWRIDTGANYLDNIETTGSESHWATFKYCPN